MHLRYSALLLLTILTALRLFQHTEDPSVTATTVEEPDTIRFAPVKLSLFIVNLVAMVRKPSHLQLVLWNTPPSRMMTSWMLVLSGDVELNPGPPSRWRYPCTVCSKPVQSNQRGVQCDMCDLWNHATCGSVERETYLNLKGDWHCPSCLRSHLPFHNASFSNSQSTVQLTPQIYRRRAHPPRLMLRSLSRITSSVNRSMQGA